MILSPFKLPCGASLFQDITSDWAKNVTYQEFLLGILKKLNESIVAINENTKFREESQGMFDALQKRIEQVEKDFAEYKDATDADIAQKFEAMHNELLTLINNETIYLKAYVDQTRAVIEQEIEDIKVGAITVYDPTTGNIEPIQVVINNIYDSTRTDAITASEFDALELTATGYDEQEITAFSFDQFGRQILIG